MNAPIKLTTEYKHQSTADSALIDIVEIFGPTIQGEGALIGTQTVFVRTGGCDYRCSWCDTGYAVLDDYQHEWFAMDAASIMQHIETLSQNQPMWVTLSGGNPALQDFAELIKLGQAKGYRYSMETQGSIAKPWFTLLDQLTLSPKPPSSGMKFKQLGLDRCLDACADHSNVSLKFVIANQQDLRWSKDIADQYPELHCFVQPCNTSANLHKHPDDYAHLDANSERSQMLDLIAVTQSLHWHNVRVLPQLHNWLWGNKTGV